MTVQQAALNQLSSVLKDFPSADSAILRAAGVSAEQYDIALEKMAARRREIRANGGLRGTVDFDLDTVDQSVQLIKNFCE